MKKKRFIGATVFFVVACLTAFCSPAIAKEFTLGNLANIEAPLVKVRVAFMQEVFKARRYDLTVKTMPALRSIEAANGGQTDGDLLRQSVMDKVVQQNAANAEESASAANEMSSQAANMKRMVVELVTLVSGKKEAEAADVQGYDQEQIDTMAQRERFRIHLNAKSSRRQITEEPDEWDMIPEDMPPVS
ncbi:MAG: hypothetical protein JRD89_13100 [Deltaproteobacteria bacterium]|nr:hypothetical protein [Deltaproteobacteria bacterium]